MSVAAAKLTDESEGTVDGSGPQKEARLKTQLEGDE